MHWTYTVCKNSGCKTTNLLHIKKIMEKTYYATSCKWNNRAQPVKNLTWNYTTHTIIVYNVKIIFGATMIKVQGDRFTNLSILFLFWSNCYWCRILLYCMHVFACCKISLWPDRQVFRLSAKHNLHIWFQSTFACPNRSLTSSHSKNNRKSD